MNLAGFLLKSRGIPSLAKRVPGLFARFGLTEDKIASCLHTFVDITQQFDALPTLTITANLIPRYPTLIRGLQNRGVEFAIHGLTHTNYAQLSFDNQLDHISTAMQIFHSQGIKFSGFRCPYLSSNAATILAVKELGFKWESSDVVSWDVLDLAQYGPYRREAYKKITGIYNAKDARFERSLPRMIDELVEIPVSIPDDEILVDRLGVKDRSAVASIWLDVLRKSYERGELFTMQLHHERMGFCGGALARVLSEACSLNPPIWIAQLNDIADWVIELEKIRLVVDKVGEDRYRVKVVGSNRASVLVKGGCVNSLGRDWVDGYRLVNSKDFELTSSNRPDVRLWRWPDGAKSAFSCTGDIDSITIIDFARRFVEV